MKRNKYDPECWNCLNDEQYEVISKWYSELEKFDIKKTLKEEREQKKQYTHRLAYLSFILALWFGTKSAYFNMADMALTGILNWLYLIVTFVLYIVGYTLVFFALLITADMLINDYYCGLNGRFEKIWFWVRTCLAVVVIRLFVLGRTNL